MYIFMHVYIYIYVFICSKGIDVYKQWEGVPKICMNDSKHTEPPSILCDAVAGYVEPRKDFGFKSF